MNEGSASTSGASSGSPAGMLQQKYVPSSRLSFSAHPSMTSEDIFERHNDSAVDALRAKVTSLKSVRIRKFGTRV